MSSSRWSGIRPMSRRCTSGKTGASAAGRRRGAGDRYHHLPSRARRPDRRAGAAGGGGPRRPGVGRGTGARNATLSIMVGGDAEAFGRARPILEVMGGMVLQGGPGAGQYTKMCNQIAIAAGMLGVCESMHYARAAGLDPHRVLDSIEHGAAGSWSLSNLMPRAICGGLRPRFQDQALRQGPEDRSRVGSRDGPHLPGPREGLRVVPAPRGAAGAGDDGTQALLRMYERARSRPR